MLAKVCKKAALIFAVVMLLASAAMAAPAGSALTGGRTPSGDEALERELEGGITIAATGVVVGNYVNPFYTVTSQEDTVIKVSARNVYDNLGHEFNNLSNIYIGGQQTSERMIIGGVPTVIQIRYHIGFNGYKVASVYPRVGVSINGQEIIFRNVPGKTE